MKLLVIDNYDSFVFNLIHYIKELSDAEITVVKNDKITLKEVAKYDKILLSPGPGIPEEAGLMKAIIAKYAPTKSILGICLGHQAIAEVFGCKLKNLETPLHGIQSPIKKVQSDALFAGTPEVFNIGHYHSWVVDPAVSNQIIVTSVDQSGELMSIRHEKYDVRGVQFHPESVLTEYGKVLIGNWINNYKTGPTAKQKKYENSKEYSMSKSEKSMLTFLMETEKK